jgi:hypothetical protein
MIDRRTRLRMERHLAHRWRLRAAAALLAGILLAQVIAIGANGAFLAIGGDLLIFSGAILILVLTDPPSDYWKLSWPVLLLLGGTLLWASLPGWPLARSAIPFVARAHAEWLTPDLSGYGFCRMLGALAFLSVGSWIGYRRGGLRLFLALLVTAGLIDLILGLALRQYDPLHVWGFDKGIHTYRFTGTMLNANAAGSLFGVTAILALGLLQDQLMNRVGQGVRSLLPAALAIAVVASYGGCIITQARTALALTTGAFLVLILYHARSRRALLQRRNLIGLGIVVGAMIGFALLVGGSTLQRFALLDRDGAERVAIWSHYWKLARLAPLFGYGPESFGMASMRSLAAPDEALRLWFVNSAHNEPISLVIEHGWPFLALLLWGMIAMLAPFFRAGKRHSAAAVATFAALCLLVGESLVDIALDVPALSAYALALLGTLWGYSLRAEVSHRDVRMPASVIDGGGAVS